MHRNNQENTPPGQRVNPAGPYTRGGRQAGGPIRGVVRAGRSLDARTQHLQYLNSDLVADIS